jgi:hypothetical protein
VDARHKAGHDELSWKRLRHVAGDAKMIQKSKEPVFDDDNPEWTEEDFANAFYFEGGIKATDLTPEILARVARHSAQKAPKKGAKKPS